MTDSIIMERVSDAAADCLYSELVKTEDFQAFEALVAADMRTVAAGALRRCVERFDAELVASAPRGWSVHERVNRTVVTLVGAVTFERTVFLYELARADVGDIRAKGGRPCSTFTVRGASRRTSSWC